MTDGVDEVKLNKLLKQLRNLGPEYEEKLEAALSKSASEMVQTARALAPVDSGAMRDSIKQARHTAADGATHGWTITGGGPTAPHFRWVEFGTAPGKQGATATNASGRRRKVARTHPGAKARPSFFPAYRIMKKRLKGRIQTAIRRAAKAAANG